MRERIAQREKYETILHIGRYGLFFLLSFITFIAINIQPVAVDIAGLSVSQNGYSWILRLIAAFREVLGPVQPVHIIAATLIAWLYYRNINKENAKFSLTSFITGGILSLCLIIGMSFAQYENFSFITHSKYQMVIAMTALVGYWGILYAGINELLKKLDKIQLPEECLSKAGTWIDQHLLIIAIVIILLCWLPYCIIYYPGSMPYDPQYQLNQFYGISAYDNQHPLFSTLILGAIVKLGDLIYSKSLGVCLYMIFQTIVCALVYSNICVYLRKKKLPLAVSLGSIAFYALVPTFGAYAQAIVKDTLYCGVFSWLVLEYIKCFLDDEGKYGYIRLAIAASLVCLLRNEGIYIVFISVFVLLLVKRKEFKRVCVVLIAVLFAGIGFNHVFVDSIGIGKDSVSTRESMSIPFMQIARYVRDYSDELSDEEIAIIDSILDYDKLAENYDAELADKVKYTYRASATQEEWSAFWKLWAQKLIEHPEAYVDATICQCYGYFYPFHFYKGTLGYYLTMKGQVTDNEEEPIYATYVFSDETREAFSQYMDLWRTTPVLSLLVNCGAYTWVGIILLALLLRKKRWHDSLIFLIPVLVIVFCCLSPVNGYLRYYVPIMASMPLYLFVGLRPYLFSGLAENTKNEKGN